MFIQLASRVASPADERPERADPRLRPQIADPLRDYPTIAETAPGDPALRCVKQSEELESVSHPIDPRGNLNGGREIADGLRLEVGLLARSQDVLRVERPVAELVVDHIAPHLEHGHLSHKLLVERALREPGQVVEIAREAHAPIARQLLGYDLFRASGGDRGNGEVIPHVDRKRQQLELLRREPQCLAAQFEARRDAGLAERTCDQKASPWRTVDRLDSERERSDLGTVNDLEQQLGARVVDAAKSRSVEKRARCRRGTCGPPFRP